MNSPKREVRVFEGPGELALAAAQYILGLARNVDGGNFSLALAGGATPRELYAVLGRDPFAAAMPWDRVHLFWGDERAVPQDNEHSNYPLAAPLLPLIPDKQVHRVRGELGAEQAAADYAAALEAQFGGAPAFDLVLLGLGGDGHTASLFPGSPALEADSYVAPAPAPDADPRVERVTLTLPALNAARRVAFLVTGRAKAAMVKRVLDGEDLPAARVRPRDELLWFLDKAAAKEL